MRLLPAHLCKPGMRLAKSIFNEQGLVLLSENVELTSALINRLKNNGIDYLYVRDSLTDDVEIPELITDETRGKAMGKIRYAFKKIMEDSSRRRAVQHHLAREFKEVMQMIIDDISQHENAMIMLQNMGIVDNYLYQHSLNVCIYATLLGQAHGYSKDQLMTLGLGALLHDIGKTSIPVEILTKQGQLTEREYELVKEHTVIGFKLLKDEPNIPLLSAHCAFQHHERLDGSGYPRGVRGDQIHEYARWIGIVDSYDAMTSNRAYRAAMLPHQAMERLYAGSGTLYETEKIQRFRDKVALYPLGLTVKLHTGETGVVVDINAACPHRPVVRIIEDEEGNELTVPYEVDLSKKLTWMITAVDLESHPVH